MLRLRRCRVTKPCSARASRVAWHCLANQRCGRGERWPRHLSGAAGRMLRGAGRLPGASGQASGSLQCASPGCDDVGDDSIIFARVLCLSEARFSKGKEASLVCLFEWHTHTNCEHTHTRDGARVCGETIVCELRVCVKLRILCIFGVRKIMQMCLSTSRCDRLCVRDGAGRSAASMLSAPPLPSAHHAATNAGGCEHDRVPWNAPRPPISWRSSITPTPQALHQQRGRIAGRRQVTKRRRRRTT